MNETEIVRIIKENEALIYSIISKYSFYYNVEDLYQVGILGLINAYKKYDSNSQTKFSSYAYKYILGEVIYFIKNDRNIKISDEYFSIYKKYIKIKELLYSKLEREPNIDEISDFMNIESSKLVQIIESVAFTKSIENNDNYYIDERDSNDDKLLLDEELSSLDSIQKMIIDYRYYQGYNQEETAKLLGLSQSKVSREEKQVLLKLKNNLN